MNFIDFLSENYIWIIVIIILGIITIIGFIADSKSKKKIKNKEENIVQNQQYPIDNQNLNSNFNQIQNNNIDNNTNLNSNLGSIPNNNLNAVPAPNPNYINGIPNNNISNNEINPVIPNQNQNLNSQTSSNIGYVPLSEQKPTFAPTFNQPLINGVKETQANNNMINVIPQPWQPAPPQVEMPINNSIAQNQYNQSATVNPVNNMPNSMFKPEVIGPKPIEPETLPTPGFGMPNYQNQSNNISSYNQQPLNNNIPNQTNNLNQEYVITPNQMPNYNQVFQANPNQTNYNSQNINNPYNQNSSNSF